MWSILVSLYLAFPRCFEEAGAGNMCWYSDPLVFKAWTWSNGFSYPVWTRTLWLNPKKTKKREEEEEEEKGCPFESGPCLHSLVLTTILMFVVVDVFSQNMVMDIRLVYALKTFWCKKLGKWTNLGRQMIFLRTFILMIFFRTVTISVISSHKILTKF